MHTSFILLAAFSAWPNLSIAAFRPPRPPQEPDIPVAPRPPNFGPQGPGGIAPGRLTPEVPPQEQLRNNMVVLEQRLETMNQALDLGQEVVGAILSVGSVTITAAPADVTFVPTSTLPTSSFSACLSYARALSNCASNAPSFYSLNPTAQASCACYFSGPPSYIPCSSGVQWAAIPTLDVNRFDDQANQCHDFFSLQGYKKVAKVLSGKDGNQTALGARFCSNVNTDVKRSRNGTTGLNPSLAPSSTGDCQITGGAHVTSSASSSSLTTFDRAGFFTFPIVLGLFSWLMFL
ncbi:hypothetical protein K505DRAFT_379238 [Melanomma pulvis-pyrius CBS 109.77]|uniref:Extracellular membrane protein CFEM domain-containing protein n=1 Tax=Melanomma pulvis-pyrius CBS 109.77 TaxID=1314802 RepID=A0A6A6WVL3_9PLEO|nr:hypothetical protein K505DRAFT_379238 [Melanomma pulvis-pyrius CBS 109.77]